MELKDSDFEMTCPVCGGTGRYMEYDGRDTCTECKGRGTVLTPQGEKIVGFIRNNLDTLGIEDFIRRCVCREKECAPDEFPET